ncbi:hypothetical protein CYMTET_11134, partial [Cymbomonas tetramitiformis]
SQEVLEGNRCESGTDCSDCGRRGSNGGAVYLSTGSQLILNRSDVAHGVVDQYGGGIYAQAEASITMIASSVEFSEAVSGGGVATEGAALTMLDASSLSHNRADLHGGGIYVMEMTSADAPSAVEVLEGSAVDNNTCDQGDGAGMWLGGDCSLTLAGGSTLSGNSAAGGDGGGVYALAGARMTVLGSRVDSNMAAHGGGVMGGANDVEFGEGSSCRDNHARGNGGCLCLEGSEMGGRLVLNLNELSGNIADGVGGGIYLGESFSEDIQWKQTLLSGNRAQSGGGAWVGSYNTLDVNLGCEVSSNTAKYDGAGMFMSASSTLRMRNSEVNSNIAKRNGGGIYAEEKCSQVILHASNVSGNTGRSGGGIWASRKCPVAVKGGSRLTFNTATTGVGGGFSTMAGLLLDARSVVSNNVAEGSDGGAGYGSEASEIEIRGSEVSQNVAQGDGGGLYTSGLLTMSDNVMAGNAAMQGSGGGLYATLGFVDIRSNIVQNTALGNGGGVYVSYGGVLELETSELSSNSALGNGGGVFSQGNISLGNGSLVHGNSAGQNGGGVFIGETVYLVVTELSEVTDNVAADKGGGILCSGSSVSAISNGSSVDRNMAAEGGGLSLAAGLEQGMTVLRMSQSVSVRSNRAERYSGGGIAASRDCEITLTDVLFDQNWAQVDGGAVNSFGATLELRRVVMTGNLATTNGGAVSLAESSNATIADRTVFALNYASRGGAISLSKRSALLLGGAAAAPEDAAAGAARKLFQADGTFDMAAWANLTAGEESPDPCAWDNFDVCLVANVAQSAASVLFAQASHLKMGAVHVVKNAVLASDECADVAPTIHLNLMDEVLVEGAKLEANWGVGIYVGNSTTVRLTATAFEGQQAESGAGLHVAVGGAAEVVGCSFERNVAAAHGGAVHTQGNLHMRNTTLLANQALQGAAVYVELVENQDTVVEDCRVMFNVASDGAAFYLREEASGAAATELTRLHLEGNNASRGGFVGFWDPLELAASPTHPPCTDCTIVNGSNFATYATVDGWATRGVALHVAPLQAEEAGNIDVQNQITVTVQDGFGQTVSVDNTSMVTVYSADHDTCQVTGSEQRKMVTNGQVHFVTSIQLQGEPGAECQLYFNSTFGGLTYDETMSNITRVPLRYCMVGEYLTGSGILSKCEPCEAGTISFDNRSACVDCDNSCENLSDDGCEGHIECHGRDQYTVCQGSWLAPNAQYCDSEESSAACFLTRVYDCEVSAACTTGDAVDGEDESACDARSGASRSGAGLAMVQELEFCDLEAYTGGIRCGGNLPVVCSESHFMTATKDACERCPSKTYIVVMLVVVPLLMCLMLAFVFVLFSLVYDAKKFEEEVMSGEAQKNSVLMLKAKNALSLVVGYVQVMSQISSIFRKELLPDYLTFYTSNLLVINLDVGFFLNIKCFTYHFMSAYSGSSSFWITFWQSVCMPWMLAIVFALVYFYLKFRRRRQMANAEAKALKEDGVVLTKEERLEKMAEEHRWEQDMYSTCAGAALFVMMFVHPGINTTMFQLFNCEKVYYDDVGGQPQLWLRQDSSIDCSSGAWWAAMAFDLFTMVVYVFGYPIGLYFFMARFRKFQVASMDRLSVERNIHLVRNKSWIPINEIDIVHFLNYCSPEEQDGIDAAPADNESISTRMRHIYMEFKARLTGKRHVLEASKAFVRSISVKTRSPEESAMMFAKKLRRRAELRKAPPIDLYIAQSTFVEITETDINELNAQGPEIQQKEFRKRQRASSIFAPPVAARARRFERSELSDNQKQAKLLVKQGHSVPFCILHYKQDQGDHGVISIAPKTMLDSRHIGKVLGQFCDPFEDAFYYWQCYEITRRLGQTGAVVAVSWLIGENASLIYALVVSASAILVHQRYSPYKNDALDELQLAILCNQFCLHLMIIVVKLDNKNSQILGIVVMVLQAVLLTYAMTLIVPAFPPVFAALWSVSTAARSMVTEQFTIGLPKGSHCFDRRRAPEVLEPDRDMVDNPLSLVGPGDAEAVSSFENSVHAEPLNSCGSKDSDLKRGDSSAEIVTSQFEFDSLVTAENFIFTESAGADWEEHGGYAPRI